MSDNQSEQQATARAYFEIVHPDEPTLRYGLESEASFEEFYKPRGFVKLDDFQRQRARDAKIDQVEANEGTELSPQQKAAITRKLQREQQQQQEDTE